MNETNNMDMDESDKLINSDNKNCQNNEEKTSCPDNDECFICYINMDNDVPYAKINNLEETDKKYHLECLEEWINKSGRCVITDGMIESYSLYQNDNLISTHEVNNVPNTNNTLDVSITLDDYDNYVKVFPYKSYYNNYYNYPTNCNKYYNDYCND